MSEFIFPKDFIWGAAAASYQIEGAYDQDNKGESIWDRFTHQKGNILNNDTGDIACDHYNRYKQDVQLMKEIGLDSYRFSVSWPRIFPKGKGKINQKGIDFYKRLTDELLKNGIKPTATLYHWDLPQVLQENGGWANRDTVKYYHEYAMKFIEQFEGRIDTWITHNEPWVASFLGHAFGHHAPGIKDFNTALQVLHNILLSHGMVVRSFKEEEIEGKIGITANLGEFQPVSDDKEDLAAAWRQDNFINKIVLDPLFKASYPKQLFEFLTKNVGDIKIEDGDMSIISYPMDFLGINYYSRNIIGYAEEANILETKEIKNEDGQYTEMGWEVYPEGLYNVLDRVNNEYTELPLYITENGAAFNDKLSENGKVNDRDRIDYLKGHIITAHKAIQDGIPLKRYYVWSIMDNFEWAYGYSKRFGMIYVDYKDDQKRYLKESAKWYSEVINQNGVQIKD
ncbi:MAG: GH1 family beta-glucosidase [Halanaerobiales bacterium]|nr:GH1 family beta-glucosidase [Halanaerobiales bacterium]